MSCCQKGFDMKIGTHNGVFHADDVFACAALQRVFPAAEIIRSRDPKVLAECDFLLDVGGEDDPQSGKFDHHQRGFDRRRENGVKFSSFGLVWDRWGGRITKDDEVAVLVDRRLVQPVDAMDNGEALYSGGEPVFEGVSGFPVSQVISSFNPTWVEEDIDQDDAFRSALHMAEGILARQIEGARAEVNGHAMVEDAYQRAASEGCPEVVVLPLAGLPWQDVLCSLEKPTYVVFEGFNDTWMIQCVPPEAGSFEQRRPLPEAWAGLRDGDLEAVTVKGAVFCHNGRFIGGASSQDAAMEMARLALA